MTPRMMEGLTLMMDFRSGDNGLLIDQQNRTNSGQEEVMDS
jgi:hypothetical protein